MNIEKFACLTVEFYRANLERRSDDPKDSGEGTTLYRTDEIFSLSQLEQIASLADSMPVRIEVSDWMVHDDFLPVVSCRDLDIYLILENGTRKRIYHQEWRGWGKCGSQNYDPCKGLRSMEFQKDK